MAFIHDINRLTTAENEGVARLKTEAASAAAVTVGKGRGYYVEWINPAMTNGAKEYLRVSVPAGFFAELDYREIITDKERFFYRVYPASAVTIDAVGANLPALNLRNDKPSAPVNTFNRVTLTGTPTNPATTQPVFGIDGVGQRKSGETATDSVLRLLAPNSQVILELENQSNATGYAQVTLNFTLIPEIEVPV